MISRVDHVGIIKLWLLGSIAVLAVILSILGLNVVFLLLAVHHLNFIVSFVDKGAIFCASIADYSVADHPLLAAHPSIHCVVERILDGLLLGDDVELACSNLVLLPFRLRLHVDADHLGCASAGIIVKRIHEGGDVLHALVPVPCVPRIQSWGSVQHWCHLLTSRATAARGLVIVTKELQLHFVEL